MFPENRWLLPDGVDEILPENARRLEALRRDVLDLLASWGYELVEPPLVEYLDSLLSGVGEDLDLQTSKLVDQVSGRLIGVRADMTPQVARIDAHRLKRPGPSRLCYVGPVFHTRPDRFLGSRNPLQIGAELYGHAGTESDIEIARLICETLRRAGFDRTTLDVGHVGVVRSIVEAAGLDDARSAALRGILARRSTPELGTFLDAAGMPSAFRPLIEALPRLAGDVGVLETARALMPADLAAGRAAIDEVEALARAVAGRVDGVELTVDLAETRGYRYHTGLIFTSYVPGEGQEIAWGGRYDDIGSVFGTARAATGFSTDLKKLVLLGSGTLPPRGAILAPALDDKDLEQTVALLRAEGRIVVRALPGAGQAPGDYGCDHVLRRVDDGWRID